MRQVTCQDCHRQYDYDKDDFCPKCGAFNPPGNQRHPTPAPPKSAARPTYRPAPTDRSTPAAAGRGTPAAGQVVPCSVSPQYSGRGNTPEIQPGVRHSARTEGCAGCEENPRSSRRPLVITLAVLLVVIGAGVVFFTLSGQQSAGRKPVQGPALSYRHEMRSPFDVNSVTVQIDGVYLNDLSADPKIIREGYDCLAVELWVTGGTRQRDLYIDTTRLILPDGTEILPEDDALLSRRLQSLGIYPIRLSDYQWEDPLYGQLIFFVPAGTGDGATLQILEYDPGNLEDPVLRSIHEVALSLDS